MLLALSRLLSKLCNELLEEAMRCKWPDDYLDQMNKTVMKATNVCQRIPKTGTHASFFTHDAIQKHTVLYYMTWFILR